MVGVAGVAHIKSVDLLKRTAVPVLVALLTSCVGIYVFIKRRYILEIVYMVWYSLVLLLIVCLDI